MATRFSPHLLLAVMWAVCLTSLLNVSAAEYRGPVFPADIIVDMDDMEYVEPLPLPRPNSLLQRPKGRQAVFDNIDPVGSVIPQSLFYEEEEFEHPMVQTIQQKQMPTRMPKVIDVDTFSGNTLYTGEGEIIHEGIVGEYPCETEFCSGPIPLTFGMGFFDNLMLFSDVTTFKTELSNGAGTFGFSEGLNWSLPVTPQGTFTAQYGVRAVQGEMFSPVSKNQLFMTAGLFKRFDLLPAQGGVAVDWMEDSSQLGRVRMRQIRAEVSARTQKNFEFGFMGGFDVFRDRPSTRDIDWIATYYLGSPRGGAVVAQDYYLLFARKHLDSGGQVELRCGATSWGDFMFNASGEVAISDRLAVNGGISLLAPSEGRSEWGFYRESWTISMGVVLYFRGGAICRQTNMYRTLFDVAGNNSFFPRIVGR